MSIGSLMETQRGRKCKKMQCNAIRTGSAEKFLELDMDAVHHFVRSYARLIQIWWYKFVWCERTGKKYNERSQKKKHTDCVTIAPIEILRNNPKISFWRFALLLFALFEYIVIAGYARSYSLLLIRILSTRTLSLSFALDRLLALALWNLILIA